MPPIVRLFLVVTYLACSLACTATVTNDVTVVESEDTPVDEQPTGEPVLTSSVQTEPDPQIQLNAPANFSDGERSALLTQTPELSWDLIEGAVDYEVAVGSSPGASDIVGWKKVGNISSVSLSEAELPNGAMLYAAVRAVDEGGLLGKVAVSDGWQNLACPAGYVKVFGNETPGLGGPVYSEGTKSDYNWKTREERIRQISDFCAMKYEAKLKIGDDIQQGGNSGTTELDLSINVVNLETEWFEVSEGSPPLISAVSVPEGKPWVNIERSAVDHSAGADDFCNSLGSGYALINNSHWQALARDIESVPVNYGKYTHSTEFQVQAFNKGNARVGEASLAGTDSIYIGPVDPFAEPSGPYFNEVSLEALAAHPDDSFGCLDDNNAPRDCEDQWELKKRTHLLSSGEVIWDLAGNVSEWLADSVDASQGSSQAVKHRSYDDPLMWGTAEQYFSSIDHDFGLGQFTNNSSPSEATAVHRGGYSETDAGVFSANLLSDSDVESSSIGFRCVFAP